MVRTYDSPDNNGLILGCYSVAIIRPHIFGSSIIEL